MKFDPSEYRVESGTKVDLSSWPTRIRPLLRSKHRYRELHEKDVEELSELQRLHYASNQYALLLIFQGMDTSGKDAAIRRVMSGINPQGCQVTSFKQPSAEELDHDFLWRTNCHLPARGQIGIFNRSYYEEVLMVRVHPELLKTQGLAPELRSNAKVWKGRFRSIVDAEQHLHRNGTRIVKIFLHLSPQEQRKRLLERIDEPHKNWKLSLSDIEERAFWKQYMRAYESCMSATSTRHAPWYVVPADGKADAQAIVSQIVLATFRGLRLLAPGVSAERRSELKQVRASLEGESRKMAGG